MLTELATGTLFLIYLTICVAISFALYVGVSLFVTE